MPFTPSISSVCPGASVHFQSATDSLCSERCAIVADDMTGVASASPTANPTVVAATTANAPNVVANPRPDCEPACLLMTAS